MAPPTRFVADAGLLVSALLPFAQTSGPGFVKYDDCEKTKLAKVDSEALTKYAEVLGAMCDVQPNCCFARNTIKQALASLLVEMKDDAAWHMSDEEREDFILTMSRRLMNMTHLVNQAYSQQSAAPWFKAVLAKRRNEAPIADAPQPEFTTKFNRELMQAVRFRVDDKGDRGEPSIKISAPGDVEGFQPVVAEWADGRTARVSEVTIDDWHEMQKAKGRPKTLETLYDEVHPKTQHRITVRPRIDREDPKLDNSKLLYSIYEQGNHISQVKVGLFGVPGNRERDEAK